MYINYTRSVPGRANARKCADGRGPARTSAACELLVSILWNFSKFYSGLKKNSWKNIENFWSKVDFEISVENFQIFKKSRFSIFRKFSMKILIFSNFRFSMKILIFRKFSGNLDFLKIWKFPTKISKSIFDQKFSIFFLDFFLNRYRISWSFPISRLEVHGTHWSAVVRVGPRPCAHLRALTQNEYSLYTSKKSKTILN